MKAVSKRLELKSLALETVALATPRGRLIAFSIVTVAVFLSDYSWLSNLSLLQRLGWENAPSVGLTRAYWLLLHGDLAAAYLRNWLIFPVLAVFVVIIVKDVVHLCRKNELALLTHEC